MSTLKFIQIETTTTCNQRCYFCPVSQHKREKVAMSMEMFSKIVAQLADHPIEGVFLNGFNEPTYDKQLVDKVKLLHDAGLKVHLNTNGSGLTPTLSQQLLDLSIDSICVNLSTLDPHRYQATRGNQDVVRVIPHIEYVLTHSQGTQVELLILGQLDQQHYSDIQAIKQHFAAFEHQKIVICPITDFAQDATQVLKKRLYHKELRGCRGNRQNQWLHFTPTGQAILCCQDYFEHYAVGHINTDSIEMLCHSPALQQIQRWIAGDEIAPENFLCRTCVFAVTEENYLYDFFCKSCVLPQILGIEYACHHCVVYNYLS